MTVRTCIKAGFKLHRSDSTFYPTKLTTNSSFILYYKTLLPKSFKVSNTLKARQSRKMAVVERKSGMGSFALASLALIATFLICDSKGAAMPGFGTVCAKRITLYMEKSHSGSSIDVYPYRLDSSTPACHDLPSNWQDKVSSINTNGNCVIVYSLSGCSGRNVRIAPGTTSHYDLSALGIDNDIRALKQCT